MSRVTHRHVRVEKLANWLSGNGQQVASSRSHNRVTTTTITTTTLSLCIRIDSISFPCLGCLLDGLCVCVCARVPRFRLRPHQDTTRTGRVYGPAHCIWSQKCHTDAPHALPPRSRTPPAIEISGGKGWKRKGVGEGVWVCLYSVSVRLMTTCRGCSRRERDEDEIRSCLRSSLIEKLG